MWQFVQRQSTRLCPQVFFCVPVLELWLDWARTQVSQLQKTNNFVLALPSPQVPWLCDSRTGKQKDEQREIRWDSWPGQEDGWLLNCRNEPSSFPFLLDSQDFGGYDGKYFFRLALTSYMHYFLNKLIPPRPTFPQDMTEVEGKVMQEHVAYWQDLANRKSRSYSAPS